MNAFGGDSQNSNNPLPVKWLFDNTEIVNEDQRLKKHKGISRPIYGDEILSHNFKDWKWIQFDEQGKAIDSYKFLPHMFQDMSEKDRNLLRSLKPNGAKTYVKPFCNRLPKPI
jgi:hypothetical protein